jgi:regulator of cell morphogenesis and NO signaling
MRNEEDMLFPQVEALERAALESRPPEKPYVGGLSHRILVEYHEHDVVAEKMRKLRELTSNFRVPEDCPDYRGFYADLEKFERDLHEHMHLENNVLYPRSGVLESNVKLQVAGPW